MAAPNPPSQDIATILSNAGVGTLAGTSGWSIYISKHPPTPDTIILLMDAGGFDANPKWLIDDVLVQVTVRGAPFGYAAAFSKIQSIKDTLLGLAKQTVNGTVYIGIWQQGEIAMVDYDDNNRPVLMATFRIRRQPADTTNRTPFT